MIRKLSELPGIKSLSKKEQKSLIGSSIPFPCFQCRINTDCCDPAADCVRGACRIYH